MRYLKILLISSFLLFIVSCSQQNKKFDSVSAKKAMEKSNADFSSFYEKGDSTGMANLYTDNAILLPPNEDVVRGHNAIAKYWGSAYRLNRKIGPFNLRLTTTKLIGSGSSFAVETGNYDIKVFPKGKEAIEGHGKYMLVWQKQKDNSWKVSRDMWSSNLPPNPAVNKIYQKANAK